MKRSHLMLIVFGSLVIIGGTGAALFATRSGTLPAASAAVQRDPHDDHGPEAGHAADGSERHADHDEHSDHDEHAEEGAQGHGHEDHEEGVVRLNPAKRAVIQLRTVKVRRGSLDSIISLPGQVEWNTDRLVHVTPRVAGIVAGVEKTLGDTVSAGDLLCVLDSREMGDAKMEYLADLSRFGVAEADFERARTVFDNTQKLLTILESNPTPEASLQQAHNVPIGENKNRLLTAYTRMHVTQRTFERARTLFDKGVGTEQDLLEARGAYETANAGYVSTREEIAFNLQPNYLRAERDFQLARTEMRNSERALHILGMTNEQTAGLATRGDEVDMDIARNPLYSPIDGIVVERHLTHGERVDTGTRLYTIADASEVWLMGRVYERDIRRLREKQRAIVRLDAFPDQQFEGVVDYIGSQLDPATRTVEARVILPNPKRHFRPGMFGEVSVFAGGEGPAGLIVPTGALQRVEGGDVLFKLVGPDAFRQVPVKVIRRSKAFAQIDGELDMEDEIVVGDTFVLRSEAAKEEMGGGHSH